MSPIAFLLSWFPAFVLSCCYYLEDKHENTKIEKNRVLLLFFFQAEAFPDFPKLLRELGIVPKRRPGGERALHYGARGHSDHPGFYLRPLPR